MKGFSKVALVIIVAGLIIIAFVVTAMLFGKDKTISYTIDAESGESGEYAQELLSGDSSSNEDDALSVEQEEEEVYTGPKVFSGDSRSVAVMIDNDVKAAWPHAGLNNAYMIYEINVEGGASRLIAFFKYDNLPEHVGPIRSARHYFLDYVQEHDAIYCHFGWSPLAQENIPKLGINNINGIYDTYFTRIGPDKTWHNAFSSKELIQKFATRKGYRTTEKQDCIINYNEKDTNLVDGESATKLVCNFSSTHSTTFEYDETSKNYLISMRDGKTETPHVDKFTGEQFVAKNILVYQVKHKLLDDPEKKNRIDLYNEGTGTGYYLTNGKAIKITWSKASDASKTVYKDMDGNEIKFNDGITWVEIVPTSDSTAAGSFEITADVQSTSGETID